jgi:hypothetical protein
MGICQEYPHELQTYLPDGEILTSLLPHLGQTMEISPSPVYKPLVEANQAHRAARFPASGICR